MSLQDILRYGNQQTGNAFNQPYTGGSIANPNQPGGGYDPLTMLRTGAFNPAAAPAGGGETAVADTGVGSGTGGGSWDQSAEAQSLLADLNAKKAALAGQFEGLAQNELVKAQDAAAKQKDTLSRQAMQTDTGLSSQFAQAKPATAYQYSARGIGDSSYAQEAQKGIEGSFGKNITTMQADKSRAFKDIDTSLKDRANEIQRARANFYNEGGVPQFGSLDEAMGYKNSLDAQQAQVQQMSGQLAKTVAGFGATTVNGPARLTSLYNDLAGIAQKVGVPQNAKLGSAMDAVKGYYGKDWTPAVDSYYTDYFNKLVQGQV